MEDGSTQPYFIGVPGWTAMRAERHKHQAAISAALRPHSIVALQAPGPALHKL